MKFKYRNFTNEDFKHEDYYDENYYDEDDDSLFYYYVEENEVYNELEGCDDHSVYGFVVFEYNNKFYKVNYTEVLNCGREYDSCNCEEVELHKVEVEKWCNVCEPY